MTFFNKVICTYRLLYWDKQRRLWKI